MKFFTLIWRKLRDRQRLLIAYSVAGALLLVMFIGMYPSIQESMDAWDQLTEAYPEELLAAFGVEELQLDTVEKFIGVEQFSITWPLMAIFMLISLAGVGLAGEIEKGTMEILLAKPIKRWQIFFSRYGVGLITLVVFILFSILSAIPIAAVFDVDYVAEGWLWLSLLSLLFGWTVLSLSMMFSAMFSEKSRVYLSTGLVLLAMYVLNIVATLRDNLENLQYGSYFHYFDYNGALLDLTIPWETTVVFCVSAIVFTIIGAIWFQRRDISV